MKRAVIFLALALTMALAGCGAKSIRTYDGPDVTRILVYKGDRKMYLMHGGQPLKVYNIKLGFDPVGPKQFSGDGKTPEGTYLIDRRNPNSQFHLSVGISYPNPQQMAFASEQGKQPGGDIFIHGAPNSGADVVGDWTAGCIAVTNADIEEIWSMVPDGTLITIYP
ncbi:L,D-transpeptidase family protein [Pseudooceanicola sp. CBS1P-1]|uniref:L,D-transpeptidase family protein n=1 Tax=Pseudooceanicola albus TaxID=2692189 RepID=A0A6L7FYG6_9RHOB|nr:MULTISPECIES: L,D-transpeptidase family protein [Pseudooceanicola]MBT9383867.1 L,D-transpeptidase family protein [Pseudooceanicola endophyticus]MXN16719.1 L,D-transpeptidase family protein [Pseudooceanicola albus]